MSDAPTDQGRAGWPTGPSGPRNGLGIAALVLGIIGLLLSFVFVGILPGILAVVLGVMGLRRVRRGEADNRGVAIAGIVTGAIAVVLAVLIAIAVGVFWSENEDEIRNLSDCVEDADTEQERDDCANRFEDQVDPN